MSSYYTTAQLEEMRKAQLHQEVVENIKAIKKQLLVNVKNESKLSFGHNIETSVSNNDLGESGFVLNDIVQNEIVSVDLVKRERLDLSSLLYEKIDKTSKLEIVLKNIVDQIEKRAILSQKDVDAYERISREVKNIIEDSGIDIEDKIKMVRMRVSSYLNSGILKDELDYNYIDEKYKEYLAICKLLKMEPQNNLWETIENELVNLRALLEKHYQDEYIKKALNEIMIELGCHVKGDAILDHMEGQLYAVDGSPMCDVFLGGEGNSILFEPIVETKKGSLDKKRQIQSNANYICSMYSKIEDRASARGIILKKVYLDPANIETICTQDDIKKEKKKKEKRKKTYTIACNGDGVRNNGFL